MQTSIEIQRRGKNCHFEPTLRNDELHTDRCVIISPIDRHRADIPFARPPISEPPPLTRDRNEQDQKEVEKSTGAHGRGGRNVLRIPVQRKKQRNEDEDVAAQVSIKCRERTRGDQARKMRHKRRMPIHSPAAARRGPGCRRSSSLPVEKFDSLRRLGPRLSIRPTKT